MKLESSKLVLQKASESKDRLEFLKMFDNEYRQNPTSGVDVAEVSNIKEIYLNKYREVVEYKMLRDFIKKNLYRDAQYLNTKVVKSLEILQLRLKHLNELIDTGYSTKELQTILSMVEDQAARKQNVLDKLKKKLVWALNGLSAESNKLLSAVELVEMSSSIQNQGKNNGLKLRNDVSNKILELRARFSNIQQNMQGLNFYSVGVSSRPDVARNYIINSTSFLKRDQVVPYSKLNLGVYS